MVKALVFTRNRASLSDWISVVTPETPDSNPGRVDYLLVCGGRAPFPNCDLSFHLARGDQDTHHTVFLGACHVRALALYTKVGQVARAAARRSMPPSPFWVLQDNPRILQTK